jgi:hypothetical protein
MSLEIVIIWLLASMMAMMYVAFFTLANRPMETMKGTLYEKPTHVNK